MLEETVRVTEPVELELALDVALADAELVALDEELLEVVTEPLEQLDAEGDELDETLSLNDEEYVGDSEVEWLTEPLEEPDTVTESVEVELALEEPVELELALEELLADEEVVALAVELSDVVTEPL